MKKFFSRIAMLLSISVLLLPHLALAHERQLFTVGTSEYLFTIGSLNEPVYVGDKTGVDLRVSDATVPTAQVPVAGLEKTLKVEIAAGEQKKVFDLSAAYNDPGAYRVPFYPTIQTTYTYRVFGTLGEVPVDLSFSCNPAGHPQTADDTSSVQISDKVTRKLKAGAFGCPKPKEDVAFPAVSAASGASSSSRTASMVALALSAIAIGVSFAARKK